MSEKRLVCPKCGSEEIEQIGRLDASWGGEAWAVEDGMEWRDDNNGADVFWDAYEITGYRCTACDHEVKDLNNLKERDDDDEAQAD